ncbi:hypothetical protein [Fructobacillus parabroussonetiae]|uniref:Uncharacterized protein n=1 Tax=Fructobacillus parabroussonetiae TaxID=2713174 RepID=A0ABS5QYT7_9LACO|nr:hypothetical protein [Fructobacillus parabroussonetiae]MBS9337805.1 hypothetical protein [Fructobacillus parabroussonetiae]MCK8617666.1 hypothetical protein [Fructobacillus parabroussonetiae]
MMQVKLSAQPQINFFNQLKNSWTKIKEHFEVVPLKEQQNSTVLINRLEAAINNGQPVAVQMNYGFDQERIQDFFGIVFQDKAGALLIEDEMTNRCHQLAPALLRHIG